MNKSQIRFAMAAHAAWLVMKNPVLTRVYMEQWEKLHPRPLSVEGEELSLYGYVFQVMYKAAWVKQPEKGIKALGKSFINCTEPCR